MSLSFFLNIHKCFLFLLIDLLYIFPYIVFTIDFIREKKEILANDGIKFDIAGLFLIIPLKS